MSEQEAAHLSPVAEALARARALSAPERARVLAVLDRDDQRARLTTKDAVIHTLAVLVVEAERIIRETEEFRRQESGDPPPIPLGRSAPGR